jgi:periplasmic mercuric ion binding protein
MTMRKAMSGLLLLLGTALTYAAPPKLVILDVQNMTCPACSITIEKALDRVPGVTYTKVDTKAGTVVVRFDPERTTVPELARAITDAGFPARQKNDGR